MSVTKLSKHVNAHRSAVYKAFVDPRAISKWRVPDGMVSQVHSFDARKGGRFRISLTYDAISGSGKTSGRTDTYHGYFAELVENERIVEVVEFETASPAFQGKMTITTTFVDADVGTSVTILHEGIPAGISPADNELGTQMSLSKLAALVETGHK